jgi:hypothetical protein
MTIISFSDEASKVYDFLAENANNYKQERMLFNALNKKLAQVKQDPTFGQPIKKGLIPKYYRLRFAVTNLYRVELPQFWRMIYTITKQGQNIEIIAFILDVCDHKEYDKRFKYKGK